jgi:hypothetical protein
MGALAIDRSRSNLACIATLLTPLTPVACQKKSPWTLLLQQIHGPSIKDGRSLFRQLAVVAEWFSRRPCSFASPPFGGFAFSWCAGCWSRWLLGPCKVACRVRLELHRGNPAPVPGPKPRRVNHYRHKLLTATSSGCYTGASPGTAVPEGLGNLNGGRGIGTRGERRGGTGGMRVARSDRVPSTKPWWMGPAACPFIPSILIPRLYRSLEPALRPTLAMHGPSGRVRDS